MVFINIPVTEKVLLIFCHLRYLCSLDLCLINDNSLALCYMEPQHNWYMDYNMGVPFFFFVLGGNPSKGTHPTSGQRGQGVWDFYLTDDHHPQIEVVPFKRPTLKPPLRNSFKAHPGETVNGPPLSLAIYGSIWPLCHNIPWDHLMDAQSPYSMRPRPQRDWRCTRANPGTGVNRHLSFYKQNYNICYHRYSLRKVTKIEHHEMLGCCY